MTQAATPNATQLLQPQLDAITEQTRKLVQAERLEPAERAIAEAVANPGEVATVGQTMPPFTLPDASGRMVRSEDLLALGPVVLKFFRGRWDPYCTTELEAWRDLYPQVRGLGALFVAIAPQTVRQNDFLASQHGLPFPVLRDEACGFAGQLGVSQQLPEYLQRYYRGILVNIPFINGEESWKLPMPATMVVERGSGVLRYVEGYADFRIRPEPQRAIEAIASL